MTLARAGGFPDPVMQSQATFRAVMQALANPGQAQKLVTVDLAGRRMSPQLTSIMLTLVDHETGLWLDATLRHDAEVLDFVRFQTGATVVDAPREAAFAFSAAAEGLPPLDRFNLGTQEYPDRSTTVVLAVPALSGGRELVLRGPGIKDHRPINPRGLPEDFVAQWAANRALFPRGVDLLLASEAGVIGLPRTTRIAEGH